MYVGDSIPKDIVDKYVTEAPKLTNLFDGEVPKICGTHTFMRNSVAASRIQTITQVFNFLFNESKRNFGKPTLQCKTSIETEQSIIKSKMFEYKESGGKYLVFLSSHFVKMRDSSAFSVCTFFEESVFLFQFLNDKNAQLCQTKHNSSLKIEK